MSTRDGNHSPPAPWAPPGGRQNPNAERYLLEADALRRRQLRSALLHGSSRTWREQKRIWPSVIAGMVIVAVVLAAFRVMNVIHGVTPAPTPQPYPPASTAPATVSTPPG